MVANTSNGLIQEPRRGSQGGDGLGPAGEVLPDSVGTRLQERIGGGKNGEPLQPSRGAESAGDVGAFELPIFAPGPNSPHWPGILREYPLLAPELCDFDRFVLALGSAGLLPVGVERDAKRLGKALRKIVSSPEAKSVLRELVDGLARQHAERTASLRLIGNGVVPIQGATAITELLRRIA